MNVKIITFALLLLGFFVYQAQTTEPNRGQFLLAPEVATTSQATGGKEQPKQPEKDKKDLEKKSTEPARTDLFDQANMSRGESSADFNPHMLGDIFGYFARVRINVVATQTSTTVFTNNNNPGNTTGNPSVTTQSTQTRTILVPFSLGAFKVAENASPRPQDRVNFSWNYYDNVTGPGATSNSPSVTTQSTIINNPVLARQGITVTNVVTTFIPAAPQVSVNMNREVLDLEKTFLDGFASFAIRVPFTQQQNNAGAFGSDNIGDLTIVGKYALIMNPDTGNVLSCGLGLTVPSGPSIPTIDGNVHSTYFQPWTGYIVNFDRFYLQAFHAIVVPTDARDVTLLFNDVGLNYWLYRGRPDQLLSFIVPSIEAHVTTPLNHRGDFDPLVAPDMLVFTGGVHVGLGRNSMLSLGVTTPVTGPRPYSVEAMAQFTLRY